jgi:hypothetical protein
MKRVKRLSERNENIKNCKEGLERYIRKVKDNIQRAGVKACSMGQGGDNGVVSKTIS